MTSPIIPGATYKTRNQATLTLREHGVPLGETSLAEMASAGKGPKYAVINGRALYTDQWLFEWVQQEASRPPQLSKRGRARAAA
jgi:hypothetical protein